MTNLLLGDLQPQNFFAMLFFAFVGAIISILVHSTNRDPGATRSPFSYNFNFLLKDNGQRILLNVLLIVVVIRFSQELLGFEIKPFVALLVGISFDKLSELLRNSNLIDKK